MWTLFGRLLVSSRRRGSVSIRLIIAASLVVLMRAPVSHAQPFSDQNVLTTSADAAQSVVAADLNEDGALDVLSASSEDDEIAWYENEGGGAFSDQRVITQDADGAHSVRTSDVDGDGDQDVLSASYDGGAVSWYENNGGTFSGRRILATNVPSAISVFAADLTGDGDEDVLSASFEDDKIAWYENTGGDSFSDENVISTGAEATTSVYAAPLNGNGRVDVLAASSGTGEVVWYENTGNGTFANATVITTDAETVQSVRTADLDGDGDQDVLSASFGDDTVAWYENDGTGSFSDQKAITTDAAAAHDVHAADLHGDGDQDVLSASFEDDTIAWYENDGTGSFSDQKVITTSAEEALSVSAADLTSNGALDVLSASRGDNTVAWYENQEQEDPLPIATTFSYPVGSKVNVPERITPETNDLYPNNPEADPERESSDVGPYWRNAQDVGSYYSALGGLHAGEDWNWGSGTSDRGRAVYATANGQVLENDRIVSDGGPGAGGYAIIIEHEVPSGETYYSLYLHVVDLSSTNGEIEAPSVSGTVEKGEPIARVGDVDAFSSHLDFQIRDTNWDPDGSLYPNANPNGYYSHDGGVHNDGMTAQQVDDAFSLMRQDGLLDASDFIDNRSESPSGLTASPGDGEVSLSWNALPDSDVDGYNVYRATTSFSDLGNAEKITDTPVGTPSYADGTVDGGTTYYYRVTAVPADGPESGPSGQASATLQSLQLLGLEVNQSVQTWENDVMPLVEGKPTIVRVHLQSEEDPTPVNVRLRGTQNGVPLPFSPLDPENPNFEARPVPSEDSVEVIRRRRARMDSTLNFELRSGWLEGTVTLSLVGENINCDETPEVNSNCEIQVTFEQTGTPKITFFRVGWDDGDGNTHLPDLDVTDINSIRKRIRVMYPIKKLDIDIGGGISISCYRLSCGPPSGKESDTYEFRKSVKEKLEKKWTDDYEDGIINENHIYYGFVDEISGDYAGAAPIGGNVGFTVTDPSAHFDKIQPSTTAHEIGHVFGLEHAVKEEDNGNTGFPLYHPKGYCGSTASTAVDFPYVSDTVPPALEDNWENGMAALGPTGQGLHKLHKEVWGVNTETQEVIATSPHVSGGPNAELMSYCLAPTKNGAFPGITWTSDVTYAALEDKINTRFSPQEAPLLAEAPSRSTSTVQTPSLTSSKEKEYLLVRGRVNVLEDSLSFRSFSTITTTSGRADVIAPDSGDYTLQALDESGSVVEEISFDPSVAVTKTFSNVGSFLVPVQADPDIVKVQVLGDGEGNSLSGKSGTGASASSDVLGSKSASPNPPMVTVQYPNGGEDLSGDEVTLEWTADDPDGDSLSYTVKYSRNGGATWKALATSWPRDSLTVDASALGGTSNGLVRVQASDGFNTAQDQSDAPFGTANVPPSASIFSPSDGAVTGQSGFITLDGSGSDAEDGSLAGAALMWQTASGDSLGIGETIDVAAANFSLGTHTIELVATDSVGVADTASVSIQVSLSNDPSLLASASALVESDSLVGFGSTGTNIDFDSTSGAATVSAELYDSAPIGAGGIPESNVSHYRILINKQNGLTVGPETAVRFETDTLSGIGDPTKVQIYQRPAPSNGPFAALDTQVDSMGTPSDPSDDEIYATVPGFGVCARQRLGAAAGGALPLRCDPRRRGRRAPHLDDRQ